MPLDADALAALAQFNAQTEQTGDGKSEQKASHQSAATRAAASTEQFPATEPIALTSPSHPDQSDQASSFLSLTTGTAIDPDQRQDVPGLIAYALSEEVGIPLDWVTPDLHLEDDLRLDTLALYSVITQIEAATKMKVSDQALREAGTIGDLQALFGVALEQR